MPRHFGLTSLSFAALVILCSPSALAARKLVDYSSLPPSIRTEIENHFVDIKSKKIDEAELDNIIRFIQKNPAIKIVQASDDSAKNKYVISYEFNKSISSLSVSGNDALSTNEILKIVDLKTGDRFDAQELVEAGERVHVAYRDLGYYNPTIDIQMPPVNDQEISVHLKIKENKVTRIKDIRITSDNKSLNSSVTKTLKSYLDDPYTESKSQTLQKKIKEYLIKNKYIRADVMTPKESFTNNESQAILEFIIEKPEQYQLDFSGAKFLDVQDIQDELNLEEYYSASPTVGNEIAQKIKNYYLAKGYARAEVKATETDTGPYRKKISFEINEGPKIKIEKYVFSGNFNQKQKLYVDFIKEHSSKTIASGFYNKEDLDHGLKNLILHLQNSGYLHAKIQFLRTQYNKDRDAVTIHVNLDEGALTQIDTLTFEGNDNIPSITLKEIMRIEVGPLQLAKLEESITHLKTYYQEQGYLEMSLKNERTDLVTYSADNKLAALKFEITEGPQVRAATIVLEGNTFTKDYVIRKELEFSEGDLVTPSKLNESIARLQRTGFFSSVDIQTLEQKTDIENRTLIVKVSERDPGIFTLGAGITNERELTLRGYTGVSYRNLFGTGRGVSLRLEGNYNVADIQYLESRIVLGYLEPYLFDSRVRGRVNVTRSSEVTSYDLRQVSDVRSTTYSLEKDFTSKILGIWDVWSLATIKDYGIDSTYPFDTVEQNIATTGPQLDVDFRDNPFIPTRGTFTRWNAEYASPELGSSDTIEYWKTTLSFTHYLAMMKLKDQPVVWANQIRGGYLKNLSPDGGVPWDKKGFTLGGQSTIRGYEAGTQEVFPNRNDLELQSTDPTYYVTDQSSMFLFKSELRFPIWESLGGALFYDGGIVQVDNINFKDPYRDSAGFGVRYNTPVGPLSLEWAWKLDARPNEEPWRFHLSIGTF